MAFIDRIFRNADPDLGVFRSNHRMPAQIWRLLRSDIPYASGSWANKKDTFKSLMGLDASDDAQLDELRTFYLGLSAEDKQIFMDDFTAWSIGAEHGDGTSEADFMARFGLT